MSKWVEAMALPTNDRWMVTQFLWKNIFSWCSTLRALFSDEKIILAIVNLLRCWRIILKIEPKYFKQVDLMNFKFYIR